MKKEIFSTGATVEDAYAAGCAQLGVSIDDLNVSYEVVDFPVAEKKVLFFTTQKAQPAKVKVILELPDAPKPVAKQPKKKAETTDKPVKKADKPAVKQEQPEKAAPAPKKEKTEQKPETPAKPVETAADEKETPIDLAENAKVKAAVDYLAEIAALMGVENATFTAVKKGEATIIKVDGAKLGVLIGRRGETMESLSYLASLVANRMEGDYLKLGLDVAGYRGKREQDLAALAQRIGEKVRRTGRAFAMEPMNPYERRILHSAISEMEGLRSESQGEGKDRHVVIYSTAPDASDAEPETERSRSSRGRRNDRSRSNGRRNDRRRGNGRREQAHRTNAVPEREYETVTTEEAAPVAPKRVEKVDDFEGFGFGKIEL